MKLYGKNPVIERIRVNSGSIKKLYLQKRTDLSDIVREAKKADLVFESVEKDEFKRETGDVHAQGVMAVVEEYEYTSFSDILDECIAWATVPVFLDGVTDPQNLGSIIRNLACLGGFSIVLPEHNAACINETVLRVACGGENYVKAATVTNLASALKKTKEKGIWVAGALSDGGADITKADIVFPLAVVIGSEGKGIRPGVKKCLDVELSLPMYGAPLSYNVAAAASLFCYEVNRGRGKNKE